MSAFITSALPLANGKEAFVFSIIAMNTIQAIPADVEKWQFSAKKFGLQTFRQLGLETDSVSPDAILEACKVVQSRAIETMPKDISGFYFNADIVAPEDVMELLEQDQIFLEKFQ